jgi:hypothetical protein
MREILNAALSLSWRPWRVARSFSAGASRSDLFAGDIKAEQSPGGLIGEIPNLPSTQIYSKE